MKEENGMRLKSFVKNVIVICSVVLLFGCCAGGATTTTPTAGYEMVIDAGSSGTRVFLYNYDASNPKAKITIHLLCDKKVNLPLASYANNPTAVGTSVIKPLLDDAIAELKILSPATPLSAVEVYVGGTAGMRLVPELQQIAIWNNIKIAILAEGFTNFSALTITGEDEGLYTWLDYNFINNDFESTTSGIVEIGGASAQVALALSSSTNATRTYKILNKPYYVYSSSFLGFGANQARATVNSLITESSNYCYAKGYNENGISSNGFDFNSCNSAYTDFVSQYSRASVIVSIKSLPGFSQTIFAGLGAIWDTVKPLGKKIKNLPISSSTYVASLSTECAESYMDILATFIADDDADYAAKFCANGVFVNNFIFNTLGIADGRIQGYNNIDNSNVSPITGNLKVNWTLGYVLKEHFVSSK